MRTQVVFSLLLTSCVAGGTGDDTTGGDRPEMTNGVSTLAGFSTAGFKDGDRQTNLFANPVNVSFGPDDKLYVADFDNNRLRVVDKDGNATTLIAKQTFQRPFGLVFVGNTLYVSTDRDSQGRTDANEALQQSGAIWRVDVVGKTATLVKDKCGRPRGLAALADGRIAVSDYAHHVIQILDPARGTLTPLAGTWDAAGFADGLGAAAAFDQPYHLAQRADGKLVVADFGNNRLRLVGLDGRVSTFAGSTGGFADGAIASAKFSKPQGIALSSSGDLFVTDLGNNRVRKVSGEMVTTIAGDGTAGYRDDDDKLASQFFGLEGLSVMPDGSHVFVADGTRGGEAPYNRVRVINN